jgi:alkyl hydroperoxide reductase subunit AhpC
VAALIGKHAPNFVALSTIGEIELYAWLGGRSALIAFFADETLLDALIGLHCSQIAIVAVCGATLQALLQQSDRARLRGTKAFDFPLVADPEGAIAAAYGSIIDPSRPCVIEVAPDRTIRRVHGVDAGTIDWPGTLARIRA